MKMKLEKAGKTFTWHRWVGVPNGNFLPLFLPHCLGGEKDQTRSELEKNLKKDDLFSLLPFFM